MMWRPIFNPIFALMLIAYIFIHLGRTEMYDLPNWANNYITDFLCMPIILSLCLVAVRKIKRIPTFQLTAFMIFGMTAFYAVLFEYYLPLKSTNYTRDIWDVLMYVIGAVVYTFILQPKFSKQ